MSLDNLLVLFLFYILPAIICVGLWWFEVGVFSEKEKSPVSCALIPFGNIIVVIFALQEIISMAFRKFNANAENFKNKHRG